MGQYSDLHTYMAQIDKLPVLATWEEKKLAKNLTPANREKLIAHNLRLVVNIAKRYPTEDIGLNDLIQVGTLGLIRAIDKFDANRKPYSKLSTYATPWIQQKIAKFLKGQRSTISLGPSAATLLYRYTQAHSILYSRKGVEPKPKEVAKYIDEDYNKIRHILGVSRHIISINDDSSEIAPITERLAGDQEKDADEIIDEIIAVEKIRAGLRELTKLECKILEMLFGFNGRKEMNVAEIATLLSMAEGKIRKIKYKAFRKIKHQFYPIYFRPMRRTFCTICSIATSGKSRCAKCRTPVRYKKRPKIPARVRASVMREPKCGICGDDQLAPGESWSIDHIIPLSKGGHSIERSNLQKAHLHCNQRKNSKRK